MMIEVKLFATLRDGREKAYNFPADEYHTPAEILSSLNIPAEEVSLILVNGFHSRPDTPLKDSDMVSFFPPCAGG